MNLVVDASVIVKWALKDSEIEDDQEKAKALLAQIQAGAVALLQPPHWLTEVAAVLTRLRPEIAEEVIELLDAMDFPVMSEAAVLKRASRISRQLNHHLFDTLYHAVALEHGLTLVTADDTYFRKSRKLGRIVWLRSWSRLDS